MMVMGSVTLNTRAERRKLLNKNTQTLVDTKMIGTKNTFQLKLKKNRFTSLEERDNIDGSFSEILKISQIFGPTLTIYRYFIALMQIVGISVVRTYTILTSIYFSLLFD